MLSFVFGVSDCNCKDLIQGVLCTGISMESDEKARPASDLEILPVKGKNADSCVDSDVGLPSSKQLGCPWYLVTGL